ncbi:MAG: signal peptidase I [Lachnospiraceae bacterium]|nr:signal peptidase I [Lachnospiraceae bacterium]
MNKRWRRWIVIAVTALIAWMLSHYWLQLAVVIGDSMEPTYHNLQFVLLDKHTRSLERGDVIAFRNEATDGYLIKRVIALPGDSVLIDNGILYVNGEVSSLYSNEEIAYAGIAENEISLTTNEYFVIGDNHEYSRDSRYEEIGCVYNTEIIGRVIE